MEGDNTDVDIEAECKNCNHAISEHRPTCGARFHEFAGERLCGCERPQYYGAVVSDTNMGWTEFHCNNCGNLIGLLNSMDENIYRIIEDELLLCPNCIRIKK
ncbi:MAG: hypothetical protein M3297_07980 [Thermoproteota archaeon]|jgi:hypothetical protein|nr:hypothetical protein [Thermoproteota archaeon]